MKPLYSVASLRQVEAQAHGLDLISRAGEASAKWLLAHTASHHRFSILVGPGNNGQDAIACAKQLRQAGKDVTLVSLPTNPLAVELSKEFHHVSSTPPSQWGDIIVDGLFGIGLNRAFGTDTKTLIASANQAPALRIALDIASGLDAYCGSINEGSFLADHTLSFIADKPGFYTAYGRDHSGIVHTLPLGIEHLLPPADIVLIDQRTDLPWLTRPHESHKGSYGTVAILGGQQGMVGAALLAGRAALHAGAGKVYVSLLDMAIDVDFMQPELMIQPAEMLLQLDHIDAYVIGPGLGQSRGASALLDAAIERQTPLIIDADGLNLISGNTARAKALGNRSATTLLTPHPTEAARLLALQTKDVQAQRIDSAQRLARQFNAFVTLKGSGTICTDGRKTSINSSGNALLANAGQGDVLSGIAGALLVQQLDALSALQLSCFIHGKIADREQAAYPNTIAMTASDVIAALRHTINQI